MVHVCFTSKHFTQTRETYRRSGLRRWKLTESESPCEVDVRFVAQFLLVKPPGRETRSMQGNTIVITSYNPHAPEKTVTKFVPIGADSIKKERRQSCDT
jgi:hypothetical protein